MEGFHRGGVPLWRGTTVEGFHHGGVPPWRGTTVEGFHHGGVPPWRGPLYYSTCLLSSAVTVSDAQNDDG